MPVLPSYRNQSIDLRSKSVDWFLYEGNTGIWWFYPFNSRISKKILQEMLGTYLTFLSTPFYNSLNYVKNHKVGWKNIWTLEIVAIGFLTISRGNGSQIIRLDSLNISREIWRQSLNFSIFHNWPLLLRIMYLATS